MRKALLVLAAFFCAACSNYSANLPSIKPYKMDIQQGNVVTSKMMMQLRPGMTKSQVRFVMGTPLIADSFHADRWDYLYRMAKGGKIIEQRHVILEFENDQLKRVRGDVIPAGSGDVAAEPAAKTATPKPAAAPKAKEKGLLDKLKFWKSDEAPAKSEAQPAPAEQGPVKAPATLSGEQPAPAEAKSARTPAPETKPEPAAVEESKPGSAPAAAEPKPEAAPAEEAKSAEPVKAAEPPAQPAPAKRPAPQPKPAPAPEPTAEPAKAEPAQPEPRKTIPADELPPEDDPGYFERMLEKIGF